MVLKDGYDKEDKDWIGTMEMDISRRSSTIYWFKRIWNVEIKERMRKLNSKVEKIKKRRLVWFGHGQRIGKSRRPKTILNWKPQGRWKRERPPKTWKKQVRYYLYSGNLQDGDWEFRDLWILRSERRRVL